MKKNVLALSIATMVGGLGFAGAANATLSVNESGAGHILIMPYYSAQNGNMSVFHLTNTDTTNGKAVKVRFRGASNSDDVLDFQVFLSPGDVWTAAVTKNPTTGLAQLTTADKSCTFPNFYAEGYNGTVPFVTDRLTSHLWDTPAKKAEQTLEGYVEVLTMADIPKPSVTLDATRQDPRLYTAIKHKNGVAPCTESVLAETLLVTANTKSIANIDLKTKAAQKLGTGQLVGETTFDLTRPALAPSLVGQWYVLNVEKTTTFSAAMPAIVASSQPHNVFSPQRDNTGSAALVDGTGTGVNGPTLVTADPLMKANIIKPQFYDVPDLSTPYETTAATPEAQASELTGSIARASISNQFASDAGIDAKTDWVFSLPTRRYAIAANYAAANTQGANVLSGVSVWDATATPAALKAVVQTAAGTGAVAANTAGYRVVNPDVKVGATGDNAFTAPGTSEHGVLNTVQGGYTTVNAAGQICLTIPGSKIGFWDREETQPTTTDKPVFSPGTPAKPNSMDLCGEVSVMAFSTDESALGAALTRQSVNAKYTNGWGTLASPVGHLPVLGSAFLKLSNPAAREGVSGTYGLTWSHSYTK
jgi:hypothetical protein